MVKRLVALLLIALPAFAQERVDALVKLGEVWSAVKFLDPQLATQNVDWDGALVRAVPKVGDGKNVVDVIDGMLAELKDPATRVIRAAAPRAADAKLVRWDGEDVLIVDSGVLTEEEAYEAGRTLPPELAKAKRVVFDVRSGDPDIADYVLRGLPLSTTNVDVPAFRHVFHSGYAPQSGSTSGGYHSGLLVIAQPPIAASQTAPERVVFVAGARVPAAAAALWWSGKAALVSDRAITDAGVADTRTIDLGGGAKAVIRIAEPVVAGISADAVAADPLAQALALARATTPLAPRPPPRESSAMPRPQKDNAYAEMTDPDLPHRMLALFRLWSVIDRFYPYKQLIGGWDGVLREFIPRFEAAANGADYARAVMEMVARVEDGHSGAWGHPAILQQLGGPAFLPFEIRRVENEFVVTGKTENAPASLPVAIGDVVVSIDGEPLADRVKRLWKYATASHETARTHRVVAMATRGAADSFAELGVRGADGVTRTLKIARVPRARVARSGEVWRVLPQKNGGNIGYVDLNRLTVAQVDSMFEALKSTKAIVFDMRGYPNGTAWSIAPRINTKNAKVGATFRRAQIGAFSSEESTSGFYFEQPLPVSDKPKYGGRTVMLIDDRTISQAEHTGLFFEAANGTKFIGTPSAGANGDVTNLVLPGALYVGFTGHDVRHADGRQLQRVGLTPDVLVAPTIRGIREGKDEVLARAVAFLSE